MLEAKIVAMRESKVFCTLQVEGTHFYGAAPDEVAYLRESHRHMFGIRAEVEVFHDDREVEFVMLKHFIGNRLDAGYTWCSNKKLFDFGPTSCEMIASYLVDELLTKYGERNITVTVDEDGENGATVSYTKVVA